MRNSVRVIAPACAAVILAAGLMMQAFPFETPAEKADRLFCHELVKSTNVREACRKVTGIGSNVKLVDGRIVPVNYLDQGSMVNRRLKGDREFDEAAADIADLDEANSKRLVASGK